MVPASCSDDSESEPFQQSYQVVERDVVDRALTQSPEQLPAIRWLFLESWSARFYIQVFYARVVEQASCRAIGGSSRRVL